MAETETVTETPPQPAAPEKAKRQRPARRRRRRHGRVVGVWMLMTVAFMAAFAVLLGLSVLNRPLPLPGWITHRVEARVNSNLAAGRITLDRIEVAMDPGGVPRIKLRNVGVFDDRGTEVARLNDVGAKFDLQQLLRARVVADRLSLSGAQVTIRRRTDGQFDLSFGTGAGTSGSLAAVLDAVDQAFAEKPMSAIGRIEATELTITLEDARSDRVWQVTDGRLLLTQTPTTVNITVNFDVFNGTEELATTSLTFSSQKGSAAAEVGAVFSNARSSDIALQSPVLAFLDVLNAPISGALRLRFGADADLRSFAGTLEIGQGDLVVTPEAQPITVDRGKAYFTYDPAKRQISFSDLSLESEAASVQLSGKTWLQDLRPDGWPESFVGQFRLVSMMIRAEDYLPEPARFSGGLAEFRLGLDPFNLKLGKLVLQDGNSTIRLAGQASLPDGDVPGLDLALDAGLDRMSHDRLLALWPAGVAPKTRKWLSENLIGGQMSNVRAAIRVDAGQKPQVLVGMGYDGATLRFLKTLPPVHDASGYLTIDATRLTVVADAGTVTAAEGGPVNVAGTVFVIPDLTERPAPAEVFIKADGPITAALSLLNEPPFGVLDKAGKSLDLAQGHAVVQADVNIKLMKGLPREDIHYQVEGQLFDVRSDTLVKNRTLSTPSLTLTASETGVEIGGPARVGSLPLNVRWTQAIGPEQTGKSRVQGTLDLGQPFLKEFGIDLPPGTFTGKAQGDMVLDIAGGRTRFRLTSDLRGLGIRIASLAWSKPASTRGTLVITGELGDSPRIDTLELSGPGLSAKGSVTLRADGSLGEARFDRVRLGGWLDAPVTLVGRGRGVQPEVRVTGGTLDFRKASLGGAGGSGGGPVSVVLDRLTVADGIELTKFRGNFTTKGGFGGSFNARLNDGGQIAGAVAPLRGGSALRVVSENAGDVLRDANLARRIRGGAMELVLQPTGKTGTYQGTLNVRNVRVRGTPALAEILNAISVVGLLQQLNGDGIVFDDVAANFTLTPRAVFLTKTSAVGASLGLSVEGVYELGSGKLDLQGVFSPIYVLNGIGSILTRKGEGLFGFHYRVTGTSEDPKVNVNPLSLLTPGMFREIFRKPMPKPKP